MSNIKVAIMMGSQNDLSVMESAAKVLKDFVVSYEMKVLSAHRTPKETVEYVEKKTQDGCQVFICGAGGSAALSGVVAAHTTVPVIGIPLASMMPDGMDALLSTVQMPPGIPVGCVGLGKAGAKNAALLAIRILSLSDKTYEEKLLKFREDNKQKILDTKI